MKIWADHYKFKAATKGGYMLIRPKTIVVTSNYSMAEVYDKPQDLEPLERRFKVEHYSKPLF